jgi:hypothetical protein
MEGNGRKPAGKTPADPRASLYLMISTYIAGGAGVALGIYGLTNGEGAVRGLHYALPLMVGAVGLLSMVRHSIFHKSDAARSGVETEPFYMIELGFANGAIGLLALLAFFGDWGVAAEAALMLTYALYLGLAFFLVVARVRSKGLDGGRVFSMCMWVAEVAFMFYLAIAAMARAHVSPF